MYLEKPGKQILKLQHWRPLTILNTDSKLYTKIMALLLLKALPYIIPDSQQGFMKGRMLAEIMKAFDTVEIPALFHAFKKFNFGDTFLSMIEPIFTKPETYIITTVFGQSPLNLLEAAGRAAVSLPWHLI